MQCGSHVCQIMYDNNKNQICKCMYSATGQIVDASETMCGAYMHIHLPYMTLKDIAYYEV